MSRPKTKRHICDCGAVYLSVDDLHRCASRNHGQLNRNRLCGRAFGRELLLTGMKPGTGIRKMCMLFENHEGECSTENPELSFDYYEESELG